MLLRKCFGIALIASLFATVHSPVVAADDSVPKLPDINSKEWKELPDSGGLKIWDAKVGEGDVVKAGATVTIHYTGWLKNGDVFDSSVKRGKMATFPLGALIKGWQVGIPGMKPGGVRRLLIPYAMAYGESGRPPIIPAKSDLIFEIELAK
jgi:peptidylprolyl isomerase